MTTGILAIVDKRDEENVDFDEFLGAVKTILMFDNFFEEMNGVFHHLDGLKVGRVRITELAEALTKLTSQEVGSQHDLRVPPPTDIDTIYKRMSSLGQIETSGFLNQKEWLTVLFMCTTD